MVIAAQKTTHRERQDGEIRGKQIIDAVEKAIGKYGSENVTIEKIAKEVGIYQTAIYLPPKRPIKKRYQPEVRRKQIVEAAKKVIYKYGHASWLNQVEVWFSLLARYALKGASFTSLKELREAIDRFIVAYNPTAHPFEWTKIVHPKSLKRHYADLCN